MSGEVMWALSLKYIVIMQAGYEKAMQPTVAEGVVRFRVNNNIFKKTASQNMKKKRKERWSNQSPMALDWTEKCLALAT